MDNGMETLFNEMIRMEQLVAELYRLYIALFPEDGAFWNGMSNEEETHAAILHSAKDYFFDAGLFPAEALDHNLERIQNMNVSLTETIFQYGQQRPLKQTALQRSLEIEHLSGEFYYHSALAIPSQTPALDLFRELTGEGACHGKKISGLMKEYGFSES